MNSAGPLKWWRVKLWVHDEVFQQAGLGDNQDAVSQLINAVIDPFAEVKHIFKDDRRSFVALVCASDRRWVIKRYRGSGWKTWLFHWVRRTPAWREWNYGRRLLSIGVRVIVPLALVHEGLFIRRFQALITPYIDAPSLHHWLKQADTGIIPATRMDRFHLARMIGEQIGRITASGLINRDHKASNLLIDAACQRGDAEPILIDPARLKPRRGEKQVWLMIARLWRSARLAGRCEPRECFAVLRSVLRADPSLSVGNHSLRLAVKAIQDMDKQLQQLLEANRTPSPPGRGQG